jgi:hypothetical protein
MVTRTGPIWRWRLPRSGTDLLDVPPDAAPRRPPGRQAICPAMGGSSRTSPLSRSRTSRPHAPASPKISHRGAGEFGVAVANEEAECGDRFESHPVVNCRSPLTWDQGQMAFLHRASVICDTPHREGLSPDLAALGGPVLASLLTGGFLPFPARPGTARRARCDWRGFRQLGCS